MGTSHYLVPVSQTPDAPFIVKPSRMFPWVGIGYPLIVGIGLPGAAWVAAALRGQAVIDSSENLSAQAIILLLQLVALVWGTVHASRLARLRRRLALSVDGVVPPPTEFVNRVQLDDAALYRRDDRTRLVQTLMAGQAWLFRFFDDVSTGDTSFNPSPSSGQVRRSFRERTSPRRGFLTATGLLTLVWAVITVLTVVAISDAGPSDAGLMMVIIALGLVLLALLFAIGGIRNSLETAFRKRILELRGRAG